MPAALYDTREAGSEGKASLPVSSAKASRLAPVLLSVSISTLAFLAIWHHVLAFAGGTETRYFEASAPNIQVLLALFTDVIASAVVLFLSFQLSSHKRRYVRIAARSIIVFSVVFALWQMQVGLQPMLLHLVTRPAAIITLNAVPWLLLSLWFLRYPAPTKSAIRGLFLILAPLFPLLALNGSWHFLTAKDSVMRGKAAGMLPFKKGAARVVWIIFDELDNRILTEARPARLRLPEFDRLANGSLRGTRVKSPAHDTLEAIPSLLLGRIVTEQRTTLSNPLLRFQGSSGWTHFRSQSDLFGKVRTLGFNAGISGWYLPYCRIMGSELSDCAWDSGPYPYLFVERHLQTKSFLAQAAYLAAWQARSIPFRVKSLGAPIPDPPDQERIYPDSQIQTFETVLDNALRMLRNPNLNLVFIHLPVPHEPGIWNPRDKRLTDRLSNYIDNLELADRTLGEMRRVLESTGDWDSSVVLVSGDHPYRPNLWSPTWFWTPEMARITQFRWQPYVPFLLKLPNQQRGVAYDREFNSVVSSRLLLRLLEERVQSSDDVVNWLDKN